MGPNVTCLHLDRRGVRVSLLPILDRVDKFSMTAQILIYSRAIRRPGFLESRALGLSRVTETLKNRCRSRHGVICCSNYKTMLIDGSTKKNGLKRWGTGHRSRGNSLRSEDMALVS